MTPTGARSITAVCAVLFAGLVWYQVSKGTIASGIKAEGDKDAAALAELRKENRGLQDAIRRAQSEASATAVALPEAESAPAPAAESPIDRAERNRALLALVKSGNLGTLSYAAPSAYKISTKIAKLSEVLALTPAETSTLQAAADRVVSTLLGGARISVDGDALSIEMKDSPDAQAEFARMRETFAQVLGPDGHAVYDALGFKAALENSINNVGLIGYSLSITRSLGETGPMYTLVRTGTNATTLSNTGAAMRVGLPSGAPTAVPVAAGPAPAGLSAGGSAAAGAGDADRNKMANALQEARAQFTQTIAAGRGGGGTMVVPPRTLTRENLANTIGPVDALIPAGF